MNTSTSLLRFANWVKAELEIQGMSCFVADRARCRSSRKHGMIERAMNASSFVVVIVTRKSFRNPYTIEELRYFSSKKNLVPNLNFNIVRKKFDLSMFYLCRMYDNSFFFLILWDVVFKLMDIYVFFSKLIRFVLFWYWKIIY